MVIKMTTKKEYQKNIEEYWKVIRNNGELLDKFVSWITTVDEDLIKHSYLSKMNGKFFRMAREAKSILNDDTFVGAVF